jgi:hypothetical protein
MFKFGAWKILLIIFEKVLVMAAVMDRKKVSIKVFDWSVVTK